MKRNYAIKAAINLAVFSIIAFMAILLIKYCFFGNREGKHVGASAEPALTVVIDAGHGGMDGGCVSDPRGSVSSDAASKEDASGEGRVLEKDCNLQISKVLAALFRVSGYNVVMTRETDVMLDAEGLYGSAKMRDLCARLMTAQKYPDALFISIHCNKFPDASCRGLQVYYSRNDDVSREIAHSIQASTVALLQPNNKRVPKPAGSSIYVLDRAKQPSVLVECGFLSNPDEAVMLSNSEYQKKLALAIALPIISQGG